MKEQNESIQVFHKKVIPMNYLHYLKLLLVLLALSLHLGIFSVAAVSKTPVRVGFVHEPLYNFLDSAGKHHGYANAIIYNVAMRAGLDVQYVNFNNYDDEDAALEAGGIDLEITVEKSAEREKKFLFSDVPTGQISLNLLVRDDEERYAYGDPNAINSMKISAVKSDAITDDFESWYRRNNLKPVMVFYSTSEAAVAALQSRAVDGCVASFNETRKGCRVLLNYQTAALFMMLNKSRTDLAAKINAAMNEIMMENPLYEQELFREYLAPGQGNQGALTGAEKEYLRSHKLLTIAVQRHAPPFSSIDNTGHVYGIIPDYYESFADSLGVVFRYIGFDTWAETIDALRQRKVDIAGLYVDGAHRACSDGLMLLELTNSFDMVMVSHFNGKRVKKVAVLTCSRMIIADKLDSIGEKTYQLCDYNNIDGCYQAFKSGEVDGIICSSPAAEWMVNNRRLSDSVAVPFMSMRRKISSAVVEDNRLLSSAVRKMILASYTAMQSAVLANTMPQGDLHSILERIPVSLLIVFAAILLAMVISLCLTLFLLIRRHRERAVLAAEQAESDIAKVRMESMERASEEKNLFFSNISHDMRTPMNGILGFTQLALKEKDPGEIRNYLQKIAISGQLLVDLIDDTLTISRLNSGKMELRRESVKMAEMLEELIVPVRETATAKKIAFQCDIAQMANVIVIADELNVKKIFLNLLSNAVKYTPEGGTVTFSVVNNSSAEDIVDLTAVVRDTGIGISAEFLPHLYAPFTQESRAAKMASGTGLGMFIVKRLLDMMDGTISVQSELDRGTEFSVRLRFHRIRGVQVSAVPIETEPDWSAIRGKKVLLCEDNELNREITQAILQDKGMIVIPAEDGKIGVDTFADSDSGEISVVLMDIRMPNMDGYEACRRIRAMNRPDRNVPIVALTANAYEEDVRDCLAAGMDSHVAKPIDPARLLSEITRLCTRRR